MQRTTKLVLGSVAASLAALGIVVVANTLSSPAPLECEPAPPTPVAKTPAPAMTPVDRIPSFQPAPPRPIDVEPARPLPAPSR